MEKIMEAVQLMESNQSDRALVLLENFLPSANADEKYTIAELYMQWGFLEEASTILNGLLEQYPEESDIKIMLADIYIESENDEKAMHLLNDINKNDPAYIQSLIQLADLYQAEGLFEVAEQKLLTAKQLEPNEIIIDFALAELLFSTGEYKRAITYYEKAAKETKELANVSIRERLAESYAATGEYELALELFRDMPAEDADALFKHGFTAYQAGRTDIAVKAWERVIEKDPHYHSVYYQLAQAYEAEELPQEAYKTVKKGLETDEFNKELYYYAGVLAHRIGKLNESELFIREAIALDPDYKEAVLFLIEIFKKKEQFADIADLLNEIKSTGANDPLYDWELARAYIETESYKDALKHYDEAYNSLKQDSDFLQEYGYFLVEEGRMSKAITIFTSYLKQQPSDAETEEYVNRLKQTNDD
jgi:tetratricopeptide (TPR) repeat protein